MCEYIINVEAGEDYEPPKALPRYDIGRVSRPVVNAKSVITEEGVEYHIGQELTTTYVNRVIGVGTIQYFFHMELNSNSMLCARVQKGPNTEWYAL